jgi:cytochrome c biogenesis protein CcmG/thiol:disulfide interchange protein DsbE
VPETYVIDGKGRIVAQHIGDVRAEDVAELAAAVRKAGG